MGTGRVDVELESGSENLEGYMKKFSVKVTYKYSDTVEVFAETEEEAQNIAVNEAKESFECLHDIEVLQTESV